MGSFPHCPATGKNRCKCKLEAGHPGDHACYISEHGSWPNVTDASRKIIEVPMPADPWWVKWGFIVEHKGERYKVLGVSDNGNVMLESET